MKTIALYFFLLSFLLAGVLIAQDAKTDLIKLNQHYIDKDIAADMRLQLFSSWESNQLKDEHQAKFLRSKDGSSLYYGLKEREIVRTPQFSLLVDHEHKLMMIQPAIKAPIPDLVSIIDTLLKRAVKVDYQQEGPKSRYNFDFDRGPYPRIDVVFDK
jgi:hypothetical protein